MILIYLAIPVKNSPPLTARRFELRSSILCVPPKLGGNRFVRQKLFPCPFSFSFHSLPNRYCKAEVGLGE